MIIMDLSVSTTASTTKGCSQVQERHDLKCPLSVLPDHEYISFFKLKKEVEVNRNSSNGYFGTMISFYI